MSYLKSSYLYRVHFAVRAGHHKLAGHFVKQATIRGGFGFNILHQQALLANKPEELGKFKGVSVTKKSFESYKVHRLEKNHFNVLLLSNRPLGRLS